MGPIAGLDVLETRSVKSVSKRCTLYNAHHHGMCVVGFSGSVKSRWNVDR